MDFVLCYVLDFMGLLLMPYYFTLCTVRTSLQLGGGSFMNFEISNDLILLYPAGFFVRLMSLHKQ